MSVAGVFLLLLVFQLKHFVVDYLLQVPFRVMLGKFRPGWDFVFPLALHAYLHGVATLLIAAACLTDWGGHAHWWQAPSSLVVAWLALFDFSSHFLMDRLKASPRWMGRWKPLTAEQWLAADGAVAAQEVLGGIASASFNGVTSEEGKRQLLGNKLFWVSLGFDQMVHHLTDLVSAWVIAHGGRL